MIMAEVRFLRQTAGSLTKAVPGVDLSHMIGREKLLGQGLRRMSFRTEEDIMILVGIIIMTELTQLGLRKDIIDVGDMRKMTGNIVEKSWKEIEVRREIWTGREA
jgi:hypothetical protein